MARYADACHLSDAGPDVVAHELEVLARHCQEADRGRAALRAEQVWVGSAARDLTGWARRVGERLVPRLRDP